MYEVVSGSPYRLHEDSSRVAHDMGQMPIVNQSQRLIDDWKSILSLIPATGLVMPARKFVVPAGDIEWKV